MNFFKSLVRVRLGLANPYNIKPEYKLLTPQNPETQVYLDQKIQINYDTHLMRLKFKDEKKVLGNQIGQYIGLRMDGDTRNYVPVSRIDDIGYVDLLVRDMSRYSGNAFSKRLISSQKGRAFHIHGPYNQFLYNGYGKFQTLEKKVINQYRYIGILTESTAITTTFSLIESIANNFDDRTAVSLLWLADQKDDFVLIDQILSLQEKKKLSANLLLTKFDKDWTGPYGQLTLDHIKDYLPVPGEDTVIIISGADLNMENFRECTRKVGHQNLISI